MSVEATPWLNEEYETKNLTELLKEITETRTARKWTRGKSSNERNSRRVVDTRYDCGEISKRKEKPNELWEHQNE